MANQSGQTENPLKLHLEESATRYDFFKAVEVVHQLYPHCVPVGYDGPPSRECLQFHPKANFSFSPSEISSIQINENDESAPVSMETAFLSLYGRDGALPWHYTTQLRKEIKESKKDAMKMFLDIFNHRMLSFFYRAGAKYNIPRSFSSHSENVLFRNIAAFTGMATRGVRNELTEIPNSLYKYSGIFQQPRSADSLEMMLRDMFKTDISVKQFVGEWVNIDQEARSALGRRGQNNIIGKSFVIGKKTWSTQHKFRLIVGPLHFNDYETFQPGTEKCKRMIKVTRLFVGSTMLFDLEYQIKKWSAPRFQAGTQKLQLGKNTWMLKDNLDSPNEVLTRSYSVEE